MKYETGYIDGHDLKYKTFETSAADREEAIHNLYQEKGDFDHQIVYINELPDENFMVDTFYEILEAESRSKKKESHKRVSIS